MRRPRVVLIAIGLLWLHVLGVISNYIMLGQHQTPTALLGLMVIGCVLMLTIRNIGRGATWARMAYLPIIVVGVAYSIFMLFSGISTRAEMEAVATASPAPDLSYCFDCGETTPGWLGLSLWQWKMISDFVSAAIGLLLVVAAFLLFSPSANRWFRASRHQAIEF